MLKLLGMSVTASFPALSTGALAVAAHIVDLDAPPRGPNSATHLCPRGLLFLSQVKGRC
jgi:hypothetical protein